MPFNSGGFFQRLYSWRNDRDAGIEIRADRTDQDTKASDKKNNELFKSIVTEEKDNEINTQTQKTQTQNESPTVDSLIEKAKQAIAAGADREAVLQRLQQSGVPLEDL